MVTPARVLAPPTRAYRGAMTDPSRWETWEPREGDILVCTPPKCGTTWTQAIIAHLLQGGGVLPAPIPVMSPWVDADLGDASEVARSLDDQADRRVVKTHTPGDGFPVWEGVHVVAVYRHPLDVFLSLRKHGANMAARPDHPMRRPFDVCLDDFLNAPFDATAWDDDCVANLIEHYLQTVDRDRFPQLTLLHYADMVADHPGTVRRLAEALEIAADDAVVARVVEATTFGGMKAQAADYVPEGGKGLWKDDAAFFDKGGTGKWQSAFSEAQLAAYDARIAELVPDVETRRWLESGAA